MEALQSNAKHIIMGCLAYLSVNSVFATFPFWDLMYVDINVGVDWYPSLTVMLGTSFLCIWSLIYLARGKDFTGLCVGVATFFIIFFLHLIAVISSLSRLWVNDIGFENFLLVDLWLLLGLAGSVTLLALINWEFKKIHP